MEYPVFEALHQAHLLIQLGKNFVSGQNDPIKEIGHRLQLLQRCKEDGSMTSVTTFLRLECQDGTRKEGTQDYHGSGRPHSHQLVFTGRNRDDLKALHLHLQQGLVKGSQLDKKKKSKWPVHKGPSQWNQAQASYNIHHAEEDAAHGVRGFFGPLLEVAKCHQDVQVESSGQDNYAAYVAKYAPKFSDAFHEDMLNDDVDANSIAASVLRRYKPAVPEMVLQLFGQVLHPWHITTASGGKRSFEVPVPDADPVPKEISLYQNCKWRHDDMCLLEFLRKSNEEKLQEVWRPWPKHGSLRQQLPNKWRNSCRLRHGLPPSRQILRAMVGVERAVPSHGRLHGARSFEQSARNRQIHGSMYPLQPSQRQSDMDPQKHAEQRNDGRRAHPTTSQKLLRPFLCPLEPPIKIHRRQPPNRRCFGHLLQQLDSINSNKKTI